MNYTLPRYPANAKSQGFTLIELLTVIAIIGILAAIIIPVVGKVRQSARAAQAVSNAKQMGMATLLYAQENKSQILGHGDAGASAYSDKLFKQWAAYLARDPNGNGGYTAVRDRTDNILEQFRDPGVPQNNGTTRFDYLSYGATWSVNRIFNVQAGGQVDRGSAYLSGASVRHRTLNEFVDPSRTIYAMSGNGWEISSANIQDASFKGVPSSGKNLYYPHRDGTAAAVVFLDGHSAIMSFPIDPKLTQMRAFE